MEHPGFFERKGPFRLGELASRIEAEPASGVDLDLALTGVAPLFDARAGELTFLDNKKYLPQLAGTLASACLIHPAMAGRVSAGVAALVAKSPYRSFALALAAFYPDAMQPKIASGRGAAAIDPSARIEEGVEIEPGVVVGPEAWIGRGTRLAANAVVGYRCTVGRGCYIGANSTIAHALIGDRVIIHAGVRIGQDGFGFAMGPAGHLKVPQIGRVIIQDDVEIGANSTVDRGVLKDTVIGEGTKIDNLVQIAHNVAIGRHCVIVAQAGVAGSASLGDLVILGGQSGVVGHISVGDGAQIAGASHPKDNVPPGARMGGTPARPLRQWARELAFLQRSVAPGGGGAGGPGDED